MKKVSIDYSMSMNGKFVESGNTILTVIDEVADDIIRNGDDSKHMDLANGDLRKILNAMANLGGYDACYVDRVRIVEP